MFSRSIPITVIVLTMATITCGQDTERKTKELTPEAAKKQSLRWLDRFAKEQVLFHKSDVEKMRKQVADGTAEEALNWWKKSEQIRNALDSEAWRDTRAWLHDFLEVQAIFSDDEIAKFRSDAKENVKKESPADFMLILADVEKYRRKLARGSANSRALRESQLQVVRAFREREEAERIAAAEAAARAAASAPKPVQPPTQRRSPRQPTAPLINSIDVARWR